ncbi:hypothetical protein F5884DRAFT_784182 [Xylogone sp. PMI_703]|nr:hypothetical protein F5884DRAFT_784182 [Xylogone sp. PMI_703]
MKKTLLLCFIHGFKGGDDTFGNFPEHLRSLVSKGLPDINVRTIVYPKFETRGDLAECVSRFRDWLLEKVIDIEVEHQTPSPTIEPSVRTVLVGHSMGGIVAADTVISITSDQAIDSNTPEITSSNAAVLNAFMFPYIQGVLAFDTPYLGISPGVVAHGAESHYQTATEAYTQLTSLSGMIWGAKATETTTTTTTTTKTTTKKEEKKPVAALPAPPAVDPNAPSWQRWGKFAMYAGAAGAAVVAGGAAAYFNREQITEGWTWVGSHLEFVGCLVKGEELKKRVAMMVTLNKELGVGYTNVYTRLGKRALSKTDGSLVGSVIGNQRTFCNLPKKEARNYFIEAINDAASDETGAHISMFTPKDNPGYDEMSKLATKLIVQWTTNGWAKGKSESKDIRISGQQVEL